MRVLLAVLLECFQLCSDSDQRAPICDPRVLSTVFLEYFQPSPQSVPSFYWLAEHLQALSVAGHLSQTTQFMPSLAWSHLNVPKFRSIRESSECVAIYLILDLTEFHQQSFVKVGLKDLQTQHVREAIWKKGPVFSLNGPNWFDHQTAILGEEFWFCTQVMLVILDVIKVLLWLYISFARRFLGHWNNIKKHQQILNYEMTPPPLNRPRRQCPKKII